MNSLDHDGIRGHPVHHNCVVKFHVMVLMITRDIIRVSDHTLVSAATVVTGARTGEGGSGDYHSTLTTNHLLLPPQRETLNITWSGVSWSLGVKCRAVKVPSYILNDGYVSLWAGAVESVWARAVITSQ